MRETVRQLGSAAVVVAAAAALAGSLAACNIIGAVGYAVGAAAEEGNRTVLAEYTGLQGQDFAVLVYVEPVLEMDHPRLRNRLTNASTRILSQPGVGATGVVPGPRVLEFQYENPSWTTWSYERLAEEFTVGRLVLLDLVEYRLHEPGNRFTYDGQAIARLSVYEAGTPGDELAFSREVRVSFPDVTGLMRTEAPPETVAANLEQRRVNRATWLRFDHEEPKKIEY